MPQNRESGAIANRYGRETSVKIMKKLGTKPISSMSNECFLNSRRVVLKCSKEHTKCIGVSYLMLKRLDAVIGAFETKDNYYNLFELSPKIFANNMRPTRSKGPAAGKVGLVIQSVFEEKGKFLRSISIS
jgi:hypothetical protein